MVKVSIIMPIYNASDSLENSINSLINQTLKDIEIICVDDGSTDESLTLLNELSKKYDFIKVFSQKNQGSGKARNYGMDKAIGEYVAFLDADDIFIDEDALEKMYDYGAKSDAEIVCGNLKRVALNGTIEDNFNYKINNYVYFDEFKVIDSKDYGIPWAFYKNIFKRSFLNEHNIRFPDLKRGQDPVFLAEIITKTKNLYGVPVDLYGYNYAIGGGANNKINSYEKKYDYIKHFKDSIDILNKYNFTNSSKKYKNQLFKFLSFNDNCTDFEYYTIIEDIFNKPEDYFYDELEEKYIIFKLKHLLNNILEVDSKEDYLKIKEEISSLDLEKINDKELLILSNLVLNSKSYKQYQSKYKSIKKVMNKNEKIEKQNKKLNKKNKQLKKENKTILNSKSWKITKPLRSTNKKKRSLNEKMLQHSNAYTFYKNGYENLSKKNKNLIKKNKNLDNKNKNLIKRNQKLHNKKELLENELNFTDEILNYKSRTLSSTLEEVYYNRKEIKDLNNEIKDLNNEIKDLNNEIRDLNKEINTLYGELTLKDYKYWLLKRELKGEVDYKNLDKINIGYVLKGFPTLSQTFVLNEIKWLKDKGYNVKVFNHKKPEQPIDLDLDLEVVQFDYREDSLDTLKKLLVIHDIDLIHTHFAYPTCNNFTYPVAEELQIPFTFFAHAYDIFVKENAEKNQIEEVTNSKYCKGVFTLSNFHKNYLIEHGVPEDKIIITRQATDYEITPLEDKKRQIKKIISISRFVEKKGLDDLIEAAKLLEDKDYIFEIYGFGKLKEELEAKIKELNLKNISIKGILENPTEVANTFKKSDLLISPCKVAKNGDMDGIPTVIFEAMAYGIPILTTDVSAIPEVITDGKNGFMTDQNNPKALASKIKEISQLPENELFEIIKTAQNDVRDISSVNKTMNTVLDIWKNS